VADYDASQVVSEGGGWRRPRRVDRAARMRSIGGRLFKLPLAQRIVVREERLPHARP